MPLKSLSSHCFDFLIRSFIVYFVVKRAGAFKERIFGVRTAVDHSEFSSHLTTTSLNGCRLLLNPTHSSHSRLLLLSGVYFLAR